MRKIIMNSRYDTSTHEPGVEVIIKEDGKVIKCPVEPRFNYRKNRSASDILKIIECNIILKKNNEPVMTEEEEDLMLNPIPVLESEPTDLQKLAGFQVEKNIIYTDKESE